jgi:protein TorT
MKDPFFLAADYGIIEEAKRLGVRVQVLDAGGYTQLANQVSQIENCVAGGAEAVIMVAIAQDGMDNLLAELKRKNIPVVDAVNGVTSKDVSAKVLTSPRDEGFRAGEYLARQHPKGKPVKVAWLPGPAGAGFVEAFNSGFQEGIKNSGVVVAETKYGDVGKEVQARLVEDILQTHKDIDYVVGTAVMVEAAVPLLRARNLQDKVKLVSVYMTPGVYQHLQRKAVAAAGSAPVVHTARVMIDTAVRLLERKAEHTHIGTLGEVYTPADFKKLDPTSVLAPAGFKPVFSLGR